MTPFPAVATGGRTTHLPYADIAKSQDLFIDPKYLPKNFKLQKPRDMHKEDIEQLFQHLARRQEMNDNDDMLFRFKSIIESKKRIAAKYPDMMNNEPAVSPAPAPAPDADTTSRPRRQKVQRKGKQKARQQEARESDMDHESNADEPTTHILVDETMKRRLAAAGYLIPLPVNGPDYGPPQYPIDIEIYNFFMECERTNADGVDTDQTNIDPALLTVPHVQRRPVPRPRRLNVPASDTNIHSMPTPSPTPTPAPEEPGPSHRRRSSRISKGQTLHKNAR